MQMEENKEYNLKKEAASPTAALELVLLTCTIGTHKKKFVAITNIPGAYLSTKIDKLVVMVLHGALTDLLTLIYPTLYRKYVVIGSNEKPIFYVKL